LRSPLVRFLAVLLLLLPAAVEVRSQNQGVIEGEVINATSGGTPVANVPVTLWALDGQEQMMLLEDTTDGEGHVAFRDLDAQAPGYQLQAEYQGVSYWSDVAAFSQGESFLSVPVIVYDSTTSDADVWVERAHLILDFGAGTILAQELQIFVNDGSKAYIGSGLEDGGTLSFALPQGAAGLQLAEGLMACCAVETEEGFAYTRPLLPGEKDFFFGYGLAYHSDNYTLSKEIHYPIRYLDVLVADRGVAVTGPGLIAHDPVFLEDRRYLHLSAQNLAPGDPLTLHLASLPLGGGPSEPAVSGSPVLAKVAMGLGTLVVLLVLVHPFLKGRAGEGS
jgi:5-hydroxyisourate hydrolase-like protein (transthyretin family)